MRFDQHRHLRIGKQMAFQNRKQCCLYNGLSLFLAILAGISATQAADRYGTQSPAHGSPRASTIRVRSAGAESCLQFIRRSGSKGLGDSAALQWSLGYLTGSSEESSAELTHSPGGSEGVALSLRRICQSHIDYLIGDAAAVIFEELTDKRARHCGCR